MGVISKNDHQIKLYYNSETSTGKQSKAYVETSDKKIITINISKTKLTGTQWTEIASTLNLHISELVNQQHPDFIKKYGNEKVNLEHRDWLKLIENHPAVIKAPILINGKDFIVVKTPSEIAKYLENE
ncbi:arsenate reductase family protein [Algibacter pacificus]|uniref:arsenate reductase family protein n=1 Tax=Algibacter pacificus TaxID=2599389 RepID=UPI0011C8D901|nr:hypothetical protein [Algibacter pacificus]